MGVVVSFHRSYPSNSKCFNDGAFFEIANFHSETFGVCRVVSGVILGSFLGVQAQQILGTLLCLVPSGHIIFMAHVF